MNDVDIYLSIEFVITSIEVTINTKKSHRYYEDEVRNFQILILLLQ